VGTQLVRDSIFGRWCSGSARLSEAQQVLVQSQVSRPLGATRENFGPIVHGYGQYRTVRWSRMRFKSSNSGECSSRFSSVDFSSCPKQCWGMGQSVGQQPLKLFIVSVRSRLPLPALQVKTWQAKILTSTSASEPKHHGYLDAIGAETCGAKARDVAGSNPALRWPRREHHLFEARCFRNAVGSGVSGNARDSDSRVQGSSPCFPSKRSCRPMVHDT
jgi:hypothetical protein